MDAPFSFLTGFIIGGENIFSVSGNMPDAHVKNCRCRFGKMQVAHADYATL